MAHHHHHHHHHHPNFLQLDSLYCSEQVEDEHNNYLSTNTINYPPILLEQDLFWDDEELTSLLTKENQNQLSTSLHIDPLLASARSEAVEWILKVNAHYSFSALTSVLAVNYLDRFLFSFRFNHGKKKKKPWLTQLAAVACLSLAAKVEETQVPLPIELQVVVESRYLFEAKTIKRMEILVLSTLGWKMNPVTPLSFLDYITRRLGLKGFLCLEFLRRCENVLLSLLTDSRFMSYLPSVLGTATMMHVVTSVDPHLGVVYKNQLLSILGFNKEKVEECYKIMLEVMPMEDYHNGKQYRLNKRKFGSSPCSPNGVMEGPFSCDSSNDSWEVVGESETIPPSPEPLSKKTRTQDQLLSCLESNIIDSEAKINVEKKTYLNSF